MNKHRTIIADPAWKYDQPLAMTDGVKRSAVDQYETTMTVDEVCDMSEWVRSGAYRAIAGYPIHDIALLGLWITAPMLVNAVHLAVLDAWGFRAKQIVPWVKGRLDVETIDDGHHGIVRPMLIIQPGMGALTRGCVEYLILATRGKYTKLVKSHGQNGLLLAPDESVLVAPKAEHSRKPDAQYTLMERLFPGPYLELFARRHREGWTQHGDQLQ